MCNSNFTMDVQAPNHKPNTRRTSLGEKFDAWFTPAAELIPQARVAAHMEALAVLLHCCCLAA